MYSFLNQAIYQTGLLKLIASQGGATWCDTAATYSIPTLALDSWITLLRLLKNTRGVEAIIVVRHNAIKYGG